MSKGTETKKEPESISEATTKQDEIKPLHTGLEKASKNENQEQDDETGVNVIYSIIGHKINKNQRPCYVKYDESLYVVRWYGFKLDEETWEPITHM